MKTSYLYQLVNLLASMLMIVLILVFLDTGRYLQWILFTSIMGAFIQLEGSLNVVTTRLISHADQSDSSEGLRHALTFAAHIYHRSSLGGIILVFTLGGLFLQRANSGSFSENWLFEWTLFCTAYFFYYYYNHRSCTLIALDEATSFATIALISRLLNISLSFLLIVMGYSVLGLCLSILISFGTAAIFYRWMAIKKTAERLAKIGNEAAQAIPARETLYRSIMHATFILFFYSLYRAGLFVDTSFNGDTDKQASFGLALQIFFLILNVSSVPLTMRVAPLIKAIQDGCRAAVVEELAKLTVAVNSVFVIMVSGLIVAGPIVLQYIPNVAAQLPDSPTLILLGLGYLIEINIMIIVNAMLANRQYGFMKRYVLGSILSISLATIAWQIGLDIYISFIVMPLACQLFVTLPLVYRIFAAANLFGLRELASALVKRLKAVLRHPIAVGLSFN